MQPVSTALRVNVNIYALSYVKAVLTTWRQLFSLVFFYSHLMCKIHEIDTS